MTGVGSWLRDGAVICATVVGMELVAWSVHKYIMHGPGWRWHQSHHLPRTGAFEKNDLYGLLFALISVALFTSRAGGWMFQVAIGMCVYGACYALLHDVLVHGRGPVRLRPRGRLLRRLVQAHRLHHATPTRQGAVSFGFLYAPPPRSLAALLHRQRAQP